MLSVTCNNFGNFGRQKVTLFKKMPRRYFKRHFNRDKYSVEQTAIVSPAISGWSLIEGTEGQTQSSLQWVTTVVPPSDENGMRKVKHLTISLTNSTSDTLVLFYALVFVPEGYTPLPIRVPTAGSGTYMYASNQFVMSSGVIDFGAGPNRIRTPLSRNLNSGDRIFLIMATNTTAAAASQVLAQVTYAITLQ